MAIIESALEHPAAARNRQLNPTSGHDDKFQIFGWTATKRLSVTLLMYSKIQVSTTENCNPVLAGLVDTKSTKFSCKDLTTAIESKEKLTKQVFQKIFNNNVISFQNSTHNIKRSVATNLKK